MKLTNYKRGFNNTFNCSIHGTIYMNNQEWSEAFNYIKKNKRRLYEGTSAGDETGFYWTLFCEDIERIIRTNKGFLMNIRVIATRMIVEHFNLSNYTKGNYQIYVIKN